MKVCKFHGSVITESVYTWFSCKPRHCY